MGAKETVLVLQIGSLGDTVISVPCYREIARRHPDAECLLVTNYPLGSRWVPAEAILKPIGVIKGSIEYPMPLRHIGQIALLRRRIRELRPSTLYYLLPETKLTKMVRHYAFFKACGIPSITGIPWSRDLQYPRELVPGALWESEASRLLRTIGAQPGPPKDVDRDLVLSDEERTKAEHITQALGPATRFIAVSVGGKVPLNDWGDDNWTSMFAALEARQPSLGLVFVGSANERPRNDRLTTLWKGRALNTCGELTARETAAIIERASAFVGHDTGTLHLAAALNTPVVGVFSARNRPGKWFSDRERDTFFYDHVSCSGCELVVSESCPHGVLCMKRHDPLAVAKAVDKASRS